MRQIWLSSPDPHFLPRTAPFLFHGWMINTKTNGEIDIKDTDFAVANLMVEIVFLVSTPGSDGISHNFDLFIGHFREHRQGKYLVRRFFRFREIADLVTQVGMCGQ